MAWLDLTLSPSYHWRKLSETIYCDSRYKKQHVLFNINKNQELHFVIAILYIFYLFTSITILFIYFNKRPLKMTKDDFYFMLKTPFVLEILTFLS